MFLELSVNKSECELCSVNRYVYLLEKICKSADMVFVSVGENYTSYLCLVSFDVSEVRNYDIDAEHFGIRECKSAVNDENVI